MNLVSRMRNAGDAPKCCTTLVPIPMSNMGGGTNIGKNRKCIQANRKLGSLAPHRNHRLLCALATNMPPAYLLHASRPGRSGNRNRTQVRVISVNVFRNSANNPLCIAQGIVLSV